MSQFSLGSGDPGAARTTEPQPNVSLGVGRNFSLPAASSFPVSSTTSTAPSTTFTAPCATYSTPSTTRSYPTATSSPTTTGQTSSAAPTSVSDSSAASASSHNFCQLEEAISK